MDTSRQSNPNPIIVGLDIGTTKICAIVGRKAANNKIEILGIGKAPSDGVARGVVANIDRTVEGIEKAIAIASEQTNVDIKVVYVGIAGQHIKSNQHRGMYFRKDMSSEINRSDINSLIEDMHKIVMPPGEKIIHVIPQEYTIDGQYGIQDPIGHAGQRIEANFHIISGNVTAVTNIMRCVNKSNLETKELILEPLASAESVLSTEEKEAGVVLVDIGGGTTDVAIFHENIIRHTAVIPFGGNAITEDVKEGCAVMRNQAELLKVKFGSAWSQETRENEIICVTGIRNQSPKEVSVKHLSFIIQARMEEIIEAVYQEIKTSGYDSKLIAGIVFTGGGAMLKHLPQLVKYQTGMDCRIGYPNEHLVKPERMNDENYDELYSPMYATGVGLLMHGIKSAEYYEELAKKPGHKIMREKPQESVKTPKFMSLISKFKGFIDDGMSPDDDDYTS